MNVEIIEKVKKRLHKMLNDDPEMLAPYKDFINSDQDTSYDKDDHLAKALYVIDQLNTRINHAEFDEELKSELSTYVSVIFNAVMLHIHHLQGKDK